MGKMKIFQQAEPDLASILEDLIGKENWDKFFTIKGTDDPFEWYAEWPDLRGLLLAQLSSLPEVKVLVPGCGNSRLSEELYDAGFQCITNIDFSKVVIGDMLNRNMHSRPWMRWSVMDMTSMQFADKSFDVVLDKGALDALMEPELGPVPGFQYVSEVKRVLKEGGKYICLTFGESHVLGMLFPKFRYGWIVSIHLLPQNQSKKSSFKTFMVIAEKTSPTTFQTISTSFDQHTLDSSEQSRGMLEALKTENNIRTKWSIDNDIMYSHEDLKIRVKGDLSELGPGQRVQMTLGDGIKHRKIVHQVTSPLTGQIIVDDVAYKKVDGQLSLTKDLLFRRLTFERSQGLIQSEALLTDDGSNNLNVDHGYLASTYHSGIISGFMLISSYLERMASSGTAARAVVIGLGAGLLPMFLHGCFPFLKLEAAELDPVVVDIAREYFGFREDDRLKVHVTDGIKFVEEEGIGQVDILIVDVDSPDMSSAMKCPGADFIEESFLSTVKNSLSKEGLFIINLVSRSPTVKEMVISRMKVVFNKLFSLKLEEDVNEVIFALNSEDSMDVNSPEAYTRLQKLVKVKSPEMNKSIIDYAKKIKPLDG